MMVPSTSAVRCACASRLWFGALAGCLLAAPAQSAPKPGPAADTLLINAAIYPKANARSKVRALAIRGGKIVALGSVAALKAWRGPQTQVLDLKGLAVYPGFHEGHGHLLDLGMQQLSLDLDSLPSLAAVQAKVRAEAAKVPAGEWVEGAGWDQNLWAKKAFPTRLDLDELSADHPVALDRVDGHALWVNTLALTKAGITKDTPDPVGGKIQRDSHGDATGILIDKATKLVTKIIPLQPPARREEAIRAALQTCVENGITMFHDAGTGDDTIPIETALLEHGQLPVRLNVMLYGGDAGLIDRYMASGPVFKGDHQLQIRTVKLMSDGSLGSRGAALLQPYTDEPDNSGLVILTEEQIYQATKRAAAAGFQTATHAIGDRANRNALNAYARVIKDNPGKDLRLRVEHAQVLDPADIRRFGQLGILASVQYTHLTSDAPWVAQRIGAQRLADGAYVWQKLRRSGSRLVGGSDTPVESVKTLWGIYAAVTRQTKAGLPPGGWSPDQRLTMEQALASYTLNAAYAAFLDKDLGSLELNKYADLVVLDHDLFAIKPKTILKTKVVMTMVGGRTVYRAPAKS